MKYLAIIVLYVLFGTLSAHAGNDSLEYKTAVIDAGAYIPPTDTSVARAKMLLDGAAKAYRVTPMQAADVAAKGKELAGKSGIQVGMLDILDGALIVCETRCSLDQLRDFVAYYVTIRQSSRQTHQQAVRGLLILNYTAKAK